jgi:hypothetical protein
MLRRTNDPKGWLAQEGESEHQRWAELQIDLLSRSNY